MNEESLLNSQNDNQMYQQQQCDELQGVQVVQNSICNPEFMIEEQDQQDQKQNTDSDRYPQIQSENQNQNAQTGFSSYQQETSQVHSQIANILENELQSDLVDGDNDIQNIILENGEISGEQYQSSSTQKIDSEGDASQDQELLNGSQTQIRFGSSHLEEEFIDEELSNGSQTQIKSGSSHLEEEFIKYVYQLEERGKNIFYDQFNILHILNHEKESNEYQITKIKNCPLSDFDNTFIEKVIEYFNNIDHDNLYLDGEEEELNNASSFYNIYNFSQSNDTCKKQKSFAYFLKQLQENYIHKSQDQSQDSGNFIFEFYNQFILDEEMAQILHFINKLIDLMRSRCQEVMNNKRASTSY
ncbi:hypothetical protein ABPG72_017483 [Tetrahymena utriculariae]